jgi:hypothetical protein
MSGIVLTKAQMTNLRDAVKSYERWLKADEKHRQEGDELLKKVKTCAASSGNNWQQVVNDVNGLFANAFREQE